MNRAQLFICAITSVLAACAPVERQGTIAELRNKQIEVEDVEIRGGLDKAMLSYQNFLAETPESRLSPEAIRRLADLKVEKEYGLLTTSPVHQDNDPAVALPAHDPALVADIAPARLPDETTGQGEPDEDFIQRAVGAQAVPATHPGNVPADLEREGPLDAIALYQKLLEEYPLYDHNDQVLYQMSRAYEELGRVEDAMEVMNQLVRDYPQSRYTDEVHFRRGEFFFTRRQYFDAEAAYQAIVSMGESSSFYPFALYKLGWTFYKQELYEEALDNFISLLDYKVGIGYDFDQIEDEQERKRIEDTFRVISLSFSYNGGADYVARYFIEHGARSYEDLVYSNLGEYYFDKRRYADANAAYSAFVASNPFHFKAPSFQMRIIEINTAGGFPSLVLQSKKAYAGSYGLQAQYWDFFDPNRRPEVLADLKINLTDLASHYHSLYQDAELKQDKPVNFEEALHWYREFLVSFPQDHDSPAVNYQLADLLLENESFGQAALEYERTAYEYPDHEKSSKAGYAAVYAYREHYSSVLPEEKKPIRQEVVRTSVRFAETFPGHEKAAVVLGAAVDDLYDMQDFEQAVARSHQLVESFPQADIRVRQSAWIVIGHASYELEHYPEAETAYLMVLNILPEADARREGLVDNLAASIYKQGEAANANSNFRAAADHFLRVSQLAPTSGLRPNAEYDGATALIQSEDWTTAAAVLNGFRQNFPGHALQPEVTKKIAYVYREDGQVAQAAEEYERIETEADDDQVRQEALLTAAELYDEAGNSASTLKVYQRYVDYFPEPLEVNVETRNKISLLLKKANDQEGYLKQLEKIVAIDREAGGQRTDRTRYLASHAALILAEQSYGRFEAVQLVRPFEVNLHKKKALMKEATQQFNRLLEYEVPEVTAASTFYLAEIYDLFSKALLESERPDNLTAQELEQYELAIEEQAFPFEEKAIVVHESNLELIALGVYNAWVEKSLKKLAEVMPARYDRPEQESPFMMLETYTYEIKQQGVPHEVATEANGLEPAAKQAEQSMASGTDQPVAIKGDAAGPAEKADVQAASSLTADEGNISSQKQSTNNRVGSSGQ